MCPANSGAQPGISATLSALEPAVWSSSTPSSQQQRAALHNQQLTAGSLRDFGQAFAERGGMIEALPLLLADSSGRAVFCHVDVLSSHIQTELLIKSDSRRESIAVAVGIHTPTIRTLITYQVYTDTSCVVEQSTRAVVSLVNSKAERFVAGRSRKYEFIRT